MNKLYSFSYDSLIIEPPATSFGEAWELLCFYLLQKDTSDNTILRLRPPDRGVDILHEAQKTAYQCKSNELGHKGTISTAACLRSIESAKEAKGLLGWEKFTFAINSDITGSSLARIKHSCIDAGLGEPSFLVHTYWSDLCNKHTDIADRFYRNVVHVSRSRYEELISKEKELSALLEEKKPMTGSGLVSVQIASNLAPLVYRIEGLSPYLTIGDLTKQLEFLGNLRHDEDSLARSATRLRLTVMIGADVQSNSRMIGDLNPEERASLVLIADIFPIYQSRLFRGGDDFLTTANNSSYERQALLAKEERSLRYRFWNSPLAELPRHG